MFEGCKENVPPVLGTFVVKDGFETLNASVLLGVLGELVVPGVGKIKAGVAREAETGVAVGNEKLNPGLPGLILLEPVEGVVDVAVVPDRVKD